VVVSAFRVRRLVENGLHAERFGRKQSWQLKGQKFLKYFCLQSLIVSLDALQLAIGSFFGTAQMFTNLCGLKKLKIICSSQKHPAERSLYISEILEVCPLLEELKIEADGVMMIPREASNSNLIHQNLTTFCWGVSPNDSDLEFNMESLVQLMPNLKTLEILNCDFEGNHKLRFRWIFLHLHLFQVE